MRISFGNDSIKESCFEYFDHQFSVLDDVLEKSLSGILKDGFYLFPIAPGLGKSSRIQFFIRRLKEQGFPSDFGIIIFLRTLDEVDAYKSACGLDNIDFAICSSDQRLNAFGLGRDKTDKAKVLFTTQEMARVLTTSSSFSSVKDYYYGGQPRALRIWDESFTPAEPVTLRLDTITRLIEPLRPSFPSLAEQLDRLNEKAKAAGAGSCVHIPLLIGETIHKEWREIKTRLGENGDAHSLRLLERIADTRCQLDRTEREGFVLMGATRPFPKDIGPLVILDGSGSCKATYQHWEKYGTGLQRMPAAIPSYANLNINWWDCASGKTALGNPAKRSSIVAGISNLIHGKPDEDWLIIHPKASPWPVAFDIKGEIERNLSSVEADRVAFLNWGKHHGTNKFNHIRNVIVIGAWQFHERQYPVISWAATGLAPQEMTDDDIADIKAGEMQSNLLQAISRGNIRNAEKGVCGSCEVYLILPGGEHKQTLVKAVFPDCRIKAWTPLQTVLKGHAKTVVDEVRKRLVESGRRFVPKAEIAEAACLPNKQALSKILKRVEVIAMLGQADIEIEYNKFSLMR